MSTLMDYLFWRGDLTLSTDAFNDLDALILSLISYLPLKKIVPSSDSNKEIALAVAAEKFFAKIQKTDPKEEKLSSTASASFDLKLANLLGRAAECPVSQTSACQNMKKTWIS